MATTCLKVVLWGGAVLGIGSAVLTVLFTLSMQGDRHIPVVVVNRSSLPIVVDRYVEGPMGDPKEHDGTAVPANGTAASPPSLDLRYGESFRIWDARSGKLLQRRIVTSEDVERHRNADEFRLVYPG